MPYESIPPNRLSFLYQGYDVFRTLPLPLVLLVLAAGIALLFYGRVTFRLVLILNAALVAGWLGWQIGSYYGQPLIVAVLLAVVFGFLAWPLFSLAVAFMAGLAGTSLAVVILVAVTGKDEYSAIAGMLGFAIFFAIGWHLVDPAVIFFTAIQGAIMVVMPCLVLLDLSRIVRNVHMLVYSHGGSVLAAIVIFALLGGSYQYRFVSKPAPPKSASADPSPQKG